MHVCSHMCTCVYESVYGHVCTHVCVHKAHICLHASVYMTARVFPSTCVCGHACVWYKHVQCVFMFTSTYVQMCGHMCTSECALGIKQASLIPTPGSEPGPRGGSGSWSAGEGGGGAGGGPLAGEPLGRGRRDPVPVPGQAWAAAALAAVPDVPRTR